MPLEGEAQFLLILEGVTRRVNVGARETPAGRIGVRVRGKRAPHFRSVDVVDQSRGVSDDRVASLRRRYTSLGWGELAAAATFASVAALIVAPRLGTRDDVAALWASLAPLLVVLVQAGVYWLIARRWVARSPMPRAVAAVYRLLQVANVAVLAAGLWGIVVWLPTEGFLVFVVVIVWLFAVIEYVNYFVVRLADPVRRWPREVARWRRPRIVQDLRAL